MKRSELEQRIRENLREFKKATPDFQISKPNEEAAYLLLYRTGKPLIRLEIKRKNDHICIRVRKGWRGIFGRLTCIRFPLR